MNAENGEAFVKELGDTTRARFFEVDVSDTDVVEQCVGKIVEWSKSTGKQIGGVVAAAGVGNPGKVCSGYERRDGRGYCADFGNCRSLIVMASPCLLRHLTSSSISIYAVLSI